MKIWGHTLVKNEARWLWFSVSSVIEHLDKLLLWDTGSTDGTLEIIEALRKKYPGKIEFQKRGVNSPEDFTKVRSEMLNLTESDWFIVIDGDEIWWRDSINRLTDFIRNEGGNFKSLVVPTVNLVGDIFHYQPQSTGRYKIAGKTGHFNLRAINTNIPGLQALGPHGQMGWADASGKMIQDRNPSKIRLIDAPYLHATNLRRSSGSSGDAEVIKRKMKIKYEFGLEFPNDYYYPEVFFEDKPAFMESPWRTMDISFKLRSALETPAKIIKRKIMPHKVGY